MKLKKIKHGWLAGTFFDLGPTAGTWSDAGMREFFGRTDRGWPNKFAAIENVYCFWGDAVTEFAGFEHLPKLRQIHVQSASGLRSFRGIERARELCLLIAQRLGRLESVDALAGLEALEELDISSCPALRDLTPLTTLKGLRSLKADGLHAEVVFPKLAALGALETLALRDNDGVKDLAFIAGAPSLERLDLSFCRGVQDLTPLTELPSLEKVRLFGLDRGLPGRDELAGKIVDEDGVEDWK